MPNDSTTHIGNILAVLTAIASFNSFPHFLKALRTYSDPFYLEKFRRHTDPTAEMLFPSDILRSQSLDKVEQADVSKLVQELKENDKRNLQKTGSVGLELAMMAAGVPVSTIGGSEIGGNLASKTRKGLLESYTDVAREEFVEELRRTTDLAKKIKEDRLGLAEILSLPEQIRQEIVIELYNRTGKDYSAALGFKKSPLTGKRVVKVAQHGIINSLIESAKESVNNALASTSRWTGEQFNKYVAPAMLLAVAAISLASSRAITHAKEHADEQREEVQAQMRRWRSSVSRRMTNAGPGVVPSRGFFQELPETKAKREELTAKRWWD